MKRFKRMVVFVLVCCFVVGIYALSVSGYVVMSQKNRVKTEQEAASLRDVDYVLVLGCGVREDGTPSVMLSERIKAAVKVFKASKAKALLVTGDNNQKGYNEPLVMKKTAMQMGVDESDIVIDDYGFSTFESIYNAKHNFNAKKLIIITQHYHISRALYIAKALGIEAYGVSAHLDFYPRQIIWSAREILARNKDFLMCSRQAENGL